MKSEDDRSFDEVVENIQNAVDQDAKYKYSLKTIYEAHNPENVGRMSNPDAVAEITGPCGDTMEFYLIIKNGIIEEITFYTDGCGTTIACGSMATRLMKGKSIEESLNLTNQDIIDALDGLPEENLHCGKLASNTLHKAIQNYLKRMHPKLGGE